MAVSRGDCYMTLVMTDSYLPGAMVLGHSLRDTGTTKELVALVTLDTLSVDVLDELKTLYHIIAIPRISNPQPANLYVMGRPDLLFAFSKIALWRQTQYRKIVYLDADVVALQSLDSLFDLDVPFAAVPDTGWPDAFNSGLMVLTPNMGDYWALQALAASGDSFDGADQGLLNQYYEHKNWHRLSFTYNCTPNSEYQWEPAYRYHKPNIKAVHFIGTEKPWKKARHTKSGSGVYSELLGRWWSVYDRHYKETSQFVPGKSNIRSTAVQQRVFGEAVDVYYGVPPEERLPALPSTEIAPSLSSHKPAPSIVLPEPAPPAQPINPHLATQSPPPAEAPEQPRQPEQPEITHSEWDATKSAPPTRSRPEAANLPTQQYTFEEEKKPFRAPDEYPQPPKDMWYQVPETRPVPDSPKPIFPWESRRRRPHATRVFAEDSPPTPEQETASPLGSSWQENSGGIERYIRNIMENQSKKPGNGHGSEAKGVVSSPTGRRESLIISGFPAAEDRPSLPVTPAPILATTFWGEDRGEDLPPAEGVPDQAEWNPAEKLEELRRSSLVELEHLVLPTVRRLPLRTLPEAAAKSSGDMKKEPSPSDDMSDFELSVEKDEGEASAKSLSSITSRYSVSPRVVPTTSKGGTVDGDPLMKSPGSFSAESAQELDEKAISPLER